MSTTVRNLDLDTLVPEVIPGLRLLPVVHERIEMAAVVRAVLEGLRPAGVAVELPTTLLHSAIKAVRRLPRISIILSEEPGEEALAWVVAPGDPFAEALRWGLENDRPVFCVDPDLRYEQRHSDRVPDSYALLELGATRFFEILREKPGGASETEVDARREAGMAFHLKQAIEHTGGGHVLGLIGAAHVAGIGRQLCGSVAHPFARVQRSNVEIRHLHPASLTGLLGDSPLAHAVWERVRQGSDAEDIDLEATLSRKVSVVRFGLRVISGEGGEDEAQRRRRVVDYALSVGTRKEFGLRVPDRRRLGEAVWRTASGSWREQTGEEVGRWQRRLFFDFARRCARVQGQLVPGLYEWVVAARGVGDDNLAWEVFDAARTYPWQEEHAEIETARVDGNDLDLGTRRVRFRRRFFRVKRRPMALPLRERPVPENPEDWLNAFDLNGICSFPPEDLVIEDYGRFLQKKAVSILSAERRKVEPFASSMLDGIDVRETLRNLHEDRVYVRELARAPGEAGSVVVIFDRDSAGEKFPWAMTWLGEHDQESDMAFYSTNPADQVVGPGIMRATYGGFLLTSPRGRLFDVWGDPDYRFARDRGEVLLMAAVDYSLEKLIVHVAEAAPGDRMRLYASSQGKRIVHVPLASLSPVTAKKIRVLHILAGKDKRSVAKNYIW